MTLTPALLDRLQARAAQVGCSIDDLVDRLLADSDSLRRSEANLRAMLNSAWQSFTLIDRDYRVVDADEKGKAAAQAIFGKRMEPGDPILDFVLDRDRDGFNANFARALNGEYVVVEKAFPEAGFIFEIGYYPVTDRDGTVIGVCMSHQNISQRRQAEQDLRDSEAWHRTLLTNLDAGLVVHAPDGSIRLCNTAATNMLRTSPDQLKANHRWPFLREDGSDMPPEEYPVNRVIATGQPVSSYVVGMRFPNEVRWSLVNALPRFNSAGAMEEIVVSFTSITDLKRTEAELRRRDTLLEAAARASGTLLTDHDLDRAISQAMAIIGEASGQDRAYLFEMTMGRGGPLMDKLYEWVRPGIEPQINNPELQNLPFHPQFTRWFRELSRGNTLGGLVRDFPEAEQTVLEPQAIVALLVVPIIVEGHFRGFIGFDNCQESYTWTVSERAILTATASAIGAAILRQRAEDALRSSEQRANALLDAIPDLMFRLSRSGVYLDYHTAADDLYDPSGYIIGRSIEEVMPPDLVPVVYENIEKTLATGTMQTFEYQLSLPERGLRDYDARMVVSGPDEVTAIIRDITERQRQQRYQQQLMTEQERVRVISQFIRDASHEFRTPLTVIGTSLYLLQRQADPDKRQQRYQQINAQVNRLSQLVDLLLLMARLDGGIIREREPVALELLVEQTISRLDEPVITRIAPDLPAIDGDTVLLETALVQLLDNALRYGESAQLVAYVAGGQIVIEVIDTGPGIAAEDMPHIFERFWRKDDAHADPGLGLGLPLARMIIERHGGTLDAASTPGTGSTFTVRLPHR